MVAADSRRNGGYLALLAAVVIEAVKNHLGMGHQLYDNERAGATAFLESPQCAEIVHQVCGADPERVASHLLGLTKEDYKRLKRNG